MGKSRAWRDPAQANGPRPWSRQWHPFAVCKGSSRNDRVALQVCQPAVGEMPRRQIQPYGPARRVHESTTPRSVRRHCRHPLRWSSIAKGPSSTVSIPTSTTMHSDFDGASSEDIHGTPCCRDSTWSPATADAADCNRAADCNFDDAKDFHAVC